MDMMMADAFGKNEFAFICVLKFLFWSSKLNIF